MTRERNNKHHTRHNSFSMIERCNNQKNKATQKSKSKQSRNQKIKPDTITKYGEK